jgi:hypothetical protein
MLTPHFSEEETDQAVCCETVTTKCQGPRPLFQSQPCSLFLPSVCWAVALTILLWGGAFLLGVGPVEP